MAYQPKAGRFSTKKEIRDKLVEVLKDTSVENVLPERTTNVEDEALPVIGVYALKERYSTLHRNRNANGDLRIIHRRDLILAVEILAEEETDQLLSDRLDQIADEVWDAIEASDKLGGLVHDINMEEAMATEPRGGRRPQGSWIINLNITYVKKPKE